MRLLIGRQALIQLFTFGAGVVLARALDPAVFGLYAIATFLVGTLAMLGDFGLAPSLVQRKGEISDLDLRVGFTVQQLVTTAIVVVIELAAPLLVRAYPHAPPETVWLLRALAFGLYLTSWRAMSFLQLERHLRYDRIAPIEVVEAVSYQGTALVLALLGYGVWSFVWATLLRGVLGTALAYYFAPWPVRFAFDRKIATGILRFGIPFQVQQLANQASSWLTPLFVGSLIGPQAVGLLTWASSNGRKPLMLVESAARVAFPLFSRLQNDPERLEAALVRYLTLLLLPMGLWAAVLITAGADLTRLIYGAKWVPATTALATFSLVAIFDTFSWMFTVALNATGEVKRTARFYVTRSGIHAIVGTALVLVVGMTGVAAGALVAAVITFPQLMRCGGSGMGARLLPHLRWLLLPGCVGTIVGFVVHLLPGGPAQYSAIGVVTVALAYAITTAVAAPQWLRGAVAARAFQFVARSRTSWSRYASPRALG